ncbi:MAG: BatD family protein, partial [Bacteroidota bacterium]
MTRLLHIFALMLIPGFLLAQDITFEASAEPRTVVEGGFFKINFKLENADGGTMTPPDFSQFHNLGQEASPSFSFGVFCISKSVVYSYYLRPKKLGTYTIGS